MIPRFRPTVSFLDALRFLTDAVFCSSLNRAQVSAFEEAFAWRHGAAGAVFLSSGRMALRLILKALDYPAGAGIVVPAFTHFSIPAVIRAMGLTPLFADIDPATSEVTAGTIKAALAPGARAIIPTHLFGRTCPMPEILELARANGLDVIEDCAQAFGAQTQTGPAGMFGRASYFTFGTTKNFTTFSGGMALCKDAGLLERIKAEAARFGPPSKGRLIKEGIVAAAMNVATWPPVFTCALTPVLRMGKQDQPDLIHNLFDEPVKVVPESGMAAWQWRPGKAQAVAGMKQLDMLDEKNQARREAGAALLGALAQKGCSGIPAPAEPGGDHLYMSFAARRKDRFGFISVLRRLGIDSSPGYVSNCCRFPELGGAGPEQCPNAEEVARQIVHLPLFPGLGKGQIKRIAEAVAKADLEIKHV